MIGPSTRQERALAKLAQQVRDYPILFYKPRPTPLKFHMDCKHTARFLFGGKQSSKTYSTEAEVAMPMTGIESIHTPGALRKFHKPPFRVRIWVEDLKRVTEGVILPILWQLIPPSMLDTSRGRNRGYSSDKGTFYLTNGSWAQFLSYEMKAMKGESATVDMVVFDEPPPEHLYESQYHRILARGGHMIGAMTLDERRARHNIRWIDRRVRRRADGPHIMSWRVTTIENVKAMIEEAATPEEAERIRQGFENICRTLSAEEQAVSLEGLGGWLSGLVFPDFNEEVNAGYDKLGPEDFVALARKGYGFIRCGLDAGMDCPTAMSWWYTNRVPIPSLDLAEGDHVCFREYKVRGLRYPQHAERLAGLCKGMPIQGIWADTSLWNRDKNGGPPEGRAFFVAFKSICPIRRGNKNKRIGHNRLGQWLAPRPTYPEWPRMRFLAGRSKEHVNEYFMYSWAPPNRRTGQSPDETVDVDDDLIDGNRYWALGFPGVPELRKKGAVFALGRSPTTAVPVSTLVSVERALHALG